MGSSPTPTARQLYHKQYYLDNKEGYLERAHATRDALRLFVQELKKAPCTDCGLTYHPCVMDFDHVRGEKVKNISFLAAQGLRKQLLLELEKCELVCSNCHRMRTYLRTFAQPKETP